MNNFSWAKAIGFGASIWVIMFVVAAIVVSGFGIALGAGMLLTLAVLAGVVTYVFALATNAANSGQALVYGAVFALIGIILDAVISIRFQSHIFGLWQYYVGYALVLFAPWVEYEMQGTGAHPKPV